MSEVVKNKLLNFEAHPSPKVWEAVQAALADDQPQLRERLYNFQPTPPLRAWEAISSGLNEATRIVPVRKNHTPFFKYALAVAAILLTVILVNLLVKTDKPGSEVATITKPAVTPVDIKDTSAKVAKNAGQPGTTGNDKTTATLSSPSTLTRKESEARYMTVANDDGKPVRLSKKVYPVINCAEKTAATAWSKCKENIQALQAKMATSANVASTDFGGLLDMLQDLEENR